MNSTPTPERSSNWCDATAVEARERARLNFDLDVDVCIIGGGLAGLTVAREVTRRGWSAAVLEAGRIGSNASGRNCGFVLPGYASPVDKIIERVGLDHAKALWQLSEQGVAYVRDAVRATKMPGVTPVDGCLEVSTTDGSDELLPILALLGQEFGAEVEGWSTEQVRAVLRTEHYFHALHFPGAFHIHPLNYLRGLAASAEQNGARIFENTPVLEIDPAGVRKRIATAAARVRAGHIVLAGNALIGGLIPRLAETVLPVTSYVAVTAPLGERLSQAIGYAGGVTEGQWALNRFRVVGGDRLMWAGGPTLWPGAPEKAAKGFKREIARRFPSLGEVEISHAWSGVTGVAVHCMPQVGEMSPGIWLASAFGTQGLNTSAMAGELIARAIIEGDDRWRLFVPYELVWAGGNAGRTITQVAYWSRRLREGVTASAARRREALRNREAIDAATPNGGQTALEPQASQPMSVAHDPHETPTSAATDASAAASPRRSQEAASAGEAES